MNWFEPQTLEIRELPDGIQMLGLDSLMKNQHYLSGDQITYIVTLFCALIFLLGVFWVLERNAARNDAKAEWDALREHELHLKYGPPVERCGECGRPDDQPAKLHQVPDGAQ